MRTDDFDQAEKDWIIAWGKKKKENKKNVEKMELFRAYMQKFEGVSRDGKALHEVWRKWLSNQKGSKSKWYMSLPS
jgi:hypothetical protein